MSPGAGSSPVDVMPLLKICGLRHPDQAAAVAGLGADAIGVIAVPGSARHLQADARPALFAAVRHAHPSCRRVLVVVDPPEQRLAELQPEAGHDVLQLHGSESPERCAELRHRLGLEVWKALRIRCPADLEAVAAYAPAVDALLLDAWVPDQQGGSGQRIPLEWLVGFAPPLPWWLAGGLSAERLPEVLSCVQPDGLDLSSGVEDRPGEKNLERVAELIGVLRSVTGMLPASTEQAGSRQSLRSRS